MKYCSAFKLAFHHMFHQRPHSSVLFLSDRSGISDVGAVEQLQDNLIGALRSIITHRRPDDSSLFPKLLLRLPDLRTLNNHHSEKLLAFHIDPWSETLLKPEEFTLFRKGSLCVQGALHANKPCVILHNIGPALKQLTPAPTQDKTKHTGLV